MKIPRFRLLNPATAALLLIALSAAPAGAAVLGIGVHGGCVKAHDADQGTGAYGAHLDLHLSPWFALQGSVDAWLEESIPLNSDTSVGDLKVKSMPLTVTARIFLPISSTFAPFAGAGAGIYYVEKNYPQSLNDLHINDDTTQEFGWHAAAGVEVKIARLFSVYGEGRAIFADTGEKLDEAVVQDLKDFSYDSVAFTGGLTIHF
jgi:opacity protein-like surface antigen